MAVVKLHNPVTTSMVSWWLREKMMCQELIQKCLKHIPFELCQCQKYQLQVFWCNDVKETVNGSDLQTFRRFYYKNSMCSTDAYQEMFFKVK